MERMMPKMAQMNGQALKRIRKDRHLTQEQLAEKSGVDKGTISRWEKLHGDRAVRELTVQSLCKALQVEAAALVGDPPPPDRDQIPQTGLSKGQVNFRMNDIARNALALVTARYGVTRDQVVSVAPLLFFVVAEQSLKERGRRLTAAIDAADRLESVFGGMPHMPAASLVSENDALLWETRSIEKRDLFGMLVAERAGDMLPHDWEEDERNPFAVFLRNAVSEVSGTASFESWSPHGEPRYSVCADDAATIVGGDPEAVDAILSGIAPLYLMIKEIPGATPQRRAEWAKAKAAEVAEEAARFLRDLGANLGDLNGTPSTGSIEDQ